MNRFNLISPGLAVALACAAFGQRSVGTQFCNALPNSTGQVTTVTGTLGSGFGSGLHLEVTGGVPSEFGYFLVGDEVTPGLSISNGLFCLLGTATSNMYRYNVAGGVMNSLGVFDSAGVMQNVFGTSQTGSGFDVPTVIPASVPFTIASGDTWYFQYWHRDTPAAVGSSNFSLGLGVTFGLPQPIPGMVLIPAGTFDMGSDAQPGLPYNGTATTQPIHSVSISHGFWMSETEVTQAQYQAIRGTNPAGWMGPSRPVERVTWNQAMVYCASLTAQEQAAGNLPSGLEYRLPTEAEWEYACRAGTTTEFNVGAAIFCDQAWIYRSWHSQSTCYNPLGTTDVGSFAPNAFGLYDMHGNVWEWCLDSYEPYGPSALTDPFVTGGATRIFRGGSWIDDSDGCRSAIRGHNIPNGSGLDLGFRVVLAEVLAP